MSEEQITKKKSVILPIVIGVAVFVLLGCAVGGLIVYNNVAKPKKELQNQLEMGEKYLANLEYDKAILAYEAALTIDPKSIGAYLGIATAYDALVENAVMEEDYDKALQYLTSEKEVLQNGLTNIESSELENQLDKTEKQIKEITELKNTPSVAEIPPEEEKKTSKYILESGELDYRIIDELIGKNMAEANEWLAENCPDFDKIDLYNGDKQELILTSKTIHAVNIEGYSFAFDHILLFPEQDENDPIRTFSFVKKGRNQELYQDACSYFKALNGDADDVVGPDEDGNYFTGWDHMNGYSLTVGHILQPDGSVFKDIEVYVFFYTIPENVGDT